MTAASYVVSLQQAAPRLIAAVRVHLPVAEVPHRFAACLNEVYQAGRTHGIALDGQNIFVYRNAEGGTADVDFAVGAKARFAAIGRVTCTETPAGASAMTTHWGDYGGLGAAHRAVTDWCHAHGHR